MELDNVNVSKINIKKEINIGKKRIDLEYLETIEDRLSLLELKLSKMDKLIEDNLSESYKEGCETVGLSSHSEGGNTSSIGDASHAEGSCCKSIGNYSHSEGNNTQSIGESSHTEGNYNIAAGMSSHSEGICNKSSGDFSHTEGNSNISIGKCSHAQGENTIAYGYACHTEGIKTESEGIASHCGGINAKAKGDYSFSHGSNTESVGDCSNTFGFNTIALNSNEFVCGMYNEYISNNTIFSVGIGKSDNLRKNGLSINNYGKVIINDLEVNNIELKNHLSIHKNEIPIIVDKRIVDTISPANTNFLNELSLLELSNIKMRGSNEINLGIKTNMYSNNISYINNVNNIENVEYIKLDQLCFKCIGAIQELTQILTKSVNNPLNKSQITRSCDLFL